VTPNYKMEFIMIKVLKLLIIACVSISANNVLAFQYYENDAVVITWKTSSGKWRGCGPVQCVSTSYREQEDVIDYITSSRRHKNLKWVEDHGRCVIYMDSGSLGAGDYSPKKVIRLSEDRC